MTLPELSPGVFLCSHHVDALELSCSVEQVPLRTPSNPTDGHTESGRVKRDYKTALLVCELEAMLDQVKRLGEKLNLNGDRGTGWLWGKGKSGEPVRLLPTVQRRGQAFALETSDWLLMIGPYRSARPRFSFQARADYLLEVGPGKAYREIVKWWEENILPLMVGMSKDDPPVWRISRIDLAADVLGADLVASDLALIATRARQRKEHHTTQDVAGRHVGRRFTGFEIGKRGSPFYARIYDKTFQAGAEASIRKVWESNGYKPQGQQERIWRIEFEIRSQLLREMLRDDASRLSDDPVRTIEEDLDELWREAVLVRLRLKERTGEARLERRPVRDWWQQLANLDDHKPLSGHTGLPFSRVAPISNDVEQHLATALRSLATVGLLNGTPRLDDCLSSLTDFNEATGWRKGFAEMIARAEAKRDPSLKSSKQAISIRADEIVEITEFSGAKIQATYKRCRARYSLRHSVLPKNRECRTADATGLADAQRNTHT